MDIRDILAQLDEIDLQEAEDSDIAAQQQLNKEKIDYVKKQEHLYSLLKQLRELVGTSQFEESRKSIGKELVESFGYTVDEDVEDSDFMQFLQSAEQNFTGKSSAQVAEAGEIAGWVYKIFLTTFGIVEPTKQAFEHVKAINANPRYNESQKNTLVGAEIEKLVGIFVTNSAAKIVGGGFLKAVGAMLSYIPLPGPFGFILKGIGAALQSSMAEKALQGFVVWWTSKFGSKLGSWIIGTIFEKYLSKEQIGKFIREPLSIVSGFAGEMQSGEFPWETDVAQQSSTSDQGAQQRSPNYDEEVAKIQQALNAKGANVKVDGILGPETYRAFDQYGASLEETPTVAESIKYLQNRLALIENDPNNVNNFYDEYTFSEDASEESGKKKFMAKYPDLAKKHGVTITPLEPSAPEAPAAPPAAPAQPAAPEKPIGGAAKPAISKPQPASQPRPSATPAATGVGVAPFAQLDAKSRLDAMSLVKQIKLAMQDMQKVPPSVQSDAGKALTHAQQTLKTYAPDMV